MGERPSDSSPSIGATEEWNGLAEDVVMTGSLMRTIRKYLQASKKLHFSLSLVILLLKKTTSGFSFSEIYINITI